MPQIDSPPSRLVLIAVLALCIDPLISKADVQVFLDRTAWENALGGSSIQTETFNDFSGFTYTAAGAPAFQFPAGITDVGSLRFDVEQPSGNLIVGGQFFNPIDDTTFWRVEASTPNGGSLPITPAILFDQDTIGFGADWNFTFTPRATMTFGTSTITFSNHLGTGISFLGITSTTPFDRVEFDVVSPVNTLFHADNVSFAQAVPEPSMGYLCLATCCVAVMRRRRSSAYRMNG